MFLVPEGWLVPLALGALLGGALRDYVVELARSCAYFFLTFTGFTADGTYAAGWSSNITSVIRRNAEVRTCWMNLGYVEDTSSADYPHYVETAAALARQLAKAAELKKGDLVIDVGYGYGDQDMLWSRENGVTITGFNVGEEQQRIASRRIAAAGLSTDVDLRVGSATSIPLEAACADKVTSLESAFHYDTREQFFAEAFRVLRPGGRIAVADILYEAKVRPSFVDREWVSAPLSTLFHLLLIKLTAHVPKANVYGIAAAEKKLRAAGFVDVQARDISEHVAIWHNSRARALLQGWSAPLRHPEKLWPSVLERTLGLTVSAVGGAGWNIYVWSLINLCGMRYYIYSAAKPRR